jgi:N-acetylglucosamine malate deacetylase 1
MNTLIVVAHPDDEVLGAGAAAHTLAQQGHTVTACILVGNVEARHARPELAALHAQTLAASAQLGWQPPILGNFPNIKLNTVAHLDLVQFIERAMRQTQAQRIITHQPHDLNNDHTQVSLACQAAARLAHRVSKANDHPQLESLWLMEVLSSTDWAYATQPAFTPNTYVAIDESAFQAKLAALQTYVGVMREHPHSRSAECLRGLAHLRGAQANVPMAEAFNCVFQRV